MKEIIKLGVVLLLVCVVAALALGFTNEITKGPIADSIAEANKLARQEVFSTAEKFTLIATKDDVEGYVAHEKADAFLSDYGVVAEVYMAQAADDTLLGYVIRTRPNGYGGAIDVIIGFQLDGVITGVRVGDHQETPGLGAKAKTAAYYEQYDGLTATGDIAVIKEDVKDGQNAIVAITSATITSDAITSGVNLSKQVLETFN